jgi:hypothetical protein
MPPSTVIVSIVPPEAQLSLVVEQHHRAGIVAQARTQGLGARHRVGQRLGLVDELLRVPFQAMSSSSSHQRRARAGSPSVTTTADRPAL